MDDGLRIERRDGWVRLVLDRPAKANALSIALRDAVSDALDGAAADPATKAVVLTGRGATFSAGWDLSEFGRAADDAELGDAIWRSGDRFHHTLLRFPLPLIAAVNGPALGGGFDLAVCCDVLLASTTARFAHPEFPWADLLYGPLDALVGGAVARDLLLTGRELDADDALRVGLVSQVVAPHDLDATVEARLARTTAAPRDQLMNTKAKAIRRAGVELVATLEL